MSKERIYSPWAHWMALLNEVPAAAFPARAEDFPSWLEGGRRRLAEHLAPLPKAVPPEVEVSEPVACDGYRRERLVFNSEGTMSVPCFLLVPDGRDGPGPAVLAVHGHGPGKSLVCGLTTTPAPNGDYAVQLVRRGFVVLAPDLRCFGERAVPAPGRYACDFNLALWSVAGGVPLVHNLWDLWRALDVLAAHPLVDPARIGAAGLSYGGTLTFFLAATDKRIAAAVVSGYLSSWAASHRVPLNMCGSQVFPGMLGQLEHVDVGALIAPRPLLIETGRQDPIFPLPAARAAVAALRQVYEWQGQGARLAHDVFEGEHQWHGTEAIPFLARYLGLPA